jgi:hypothetical protein
VLDMGDRLLERLADVIVVEVVDHAASVAVPDHEAQIAQQPQLMRHRRGLHPDRVGQLVDRTQPRAQPPEYPYRLGVARPCILWATTPAKPGYELQGDVMRSTVRHVALNSFQVSSGGRSLCAVVRLPPDTRPPLRRLPPPATAALVRRSDTARLPEHGHRQ